MVVAAQRPIDEVDQDVEADDFKRGAYQELLGAIEGMEYAQPGGRTRG